MYSNVPRHGSQLVSTSVAHTAAIITLRVLQLPDVAEEARNARPYEIDDVRHKHPELDGVPVEQINLQRCPGEAYDDEPHHHRWVVLLQRVQDIVLHGTPLE